MTIPRLLSSLVLCLALASPAFAHKLKVFATASGGTVSGYAYFVGGGRAQGTEWTATDASGKTIAEGLTGADGAYSLAAPEPIDADITITVNTREGHIASTMVRAQHFGSTAVDTQLAAPVAGEPAADAIETAVQRQLQPVLQRLEEMDARLRFVDIMSGLFLIIGLAGIGLWARGQTA